MKLMIALVVVAAAMSACAPKDFSKEGSDAEQFTKDESQCRTQVRARAQQDRNIDDTRRATFSAERERYGQQGLYTDMANQGYKFNTERMMAFLDGESVKGTFFVQGMVAEFQVS